ncbi:MAG: MBL fold metallo-hydrolase [Pseudomonadota bacterium]
MNPYFDPARPHHRHDGFQNRYGDFQPRSLADVVRWRWAAWRAGLPRPPRALPPVVAPDLAFLRSNAAAGAAMQPAVTFIGHATTLVQMPAGTAGLTLLTDPVFSERVSPFSFIGPRRLQPPGLALAELPHVDVVLVSHNHYDHLDEYSVRALAAQPGGPPLFIVPLGLAGWMASHGVANAVELDWWDSHPVGAADITLTPAHHWSGRGLRDRMATLWGGFAVLAPDFHWFFSGDTGYSRDFADIGAHFAPRQTAAAGGGFDLALLPVGAYAPRWFMRPQHVEPSESVQIHQDIRAKRSIGVHWGTFALTDEPFDEPPYALAAARRAAGLADADFSVMAIGETRRLQRRTPSFSSASAP